MKNFIKNITLREIISALSFELSAEYAHKKFLPIGRSIDIPYNLRNEIKESAVMVLLLKKNNELCLCLTLRTQLLRHHPGQISFPGGKIEKNEDDFTETALRELKEETGINSETVFICGKLSDLYIPVSNFLIHPIVGYLDHEPHFEINTQEVDEMIIIPFYEFFMNENHTLSIVESQSGKIEVPSYTIQGKTIWGATAMIISEFTELLMTFYRKKGLY
jgi:8-oxo-dGTP pyrophosphatase MutT (NUDIX family)